MQYSQPELQQTHEALKKAASPVGAAIGALMGAIPAIATYAFFTQMGAILYVFLLIPPVIIGLAAQFTGRVYRIEHRVVVGIVASAVHVGCVYYFGYKPFLYFLVPIFFFTALSVAKRRLNRIESIAVDMEAEGRFENP